MKKTIYTQIASLINSGIFIFIYFFINIILSFSEYYITFVSKYRIGKIFIFLLLTFSLTIPINLYCQDDCLLKYQAGLLFSEQNYTEAIKTYKKMQSQQYNKYYYIAVCFCNLDLKDSAEYYLQKAIDHNFYYDEYFSYHNIENLDSDKNLSCLHSNSKLDSSLNKNNRRMYSNMNEKLKTEFLHRKEIDQNILNDFYKDSIYVSGLYKVKTAIEAFLRVRELNVIFLDSVLNVYGKWVGRDIVGKDGDNAAWLIAQHADEFVDFQEKCYKFLLEAYENNTTDYNNIPYLYDRIMINKDLKQRYGTQIRIIDDKVVFINLENDDENYIDILRSCYRLSSLKNYKKSFEKQ